jgi:hypothetical protein
MTLDLYLPPGAVPHAVTKKKSVLIDHAREQGSISILGENSSLSDLEVLFNLIFGSGLVKVDASESDDSDPSPPVDLLLAGKPVCENCHTSSHVRKRETYHTKRGEDRDYFSCDYCGTRVRTNVTGRRHTVKTVAIMLSRFFSAESTRGIQTGMLEED